MMQPRRARKCQYAGLAPSADLVPVQPSRKNLFASLRAKISFMTRAIPHSSEGRTRRHGRWVGDAMDAAVRKTRRTDADGEAVWF